MNRRKVLKNITLGALATASIPSWAAKWAGVEDLPELHHITAADEQLLKDITQTLIPETDTPGAGDLNVDKYIRAMVEAMHDESFQEKFYAQLSEVDTYSQTHYKKNFAELMGNEKTYCLTHLSHEKDAAWKSFFGTFKRYAIQGYKTSEYVMTKLNGYVMAPAYFNGCISV